MLEVKVEDNHSSLNLIITGDVSVSHIGELYADLLNVPLDASRYLLQITKVENLDLSFFQLLFAFVRRIRANDSQVTVKWDLEDEYVRILKESGIQDVFDGLLSL